MSLQVHVFPYPGRIEECFALRRRVFMDEQDVTEDEEFDGLDDTCIHLLATIDERPVGTARLRGGEGIAKAERLSVLKESRGRGVGQALMRALAEAARREGYRQILLGAQLQAIPFYEKLGYVVEGEEYLDARIRHRWMRRAIDR